MSSFYKNISIKIDSSVNSLISASSGTLYTVPANCYLVLSNWDSSRYITSGTAVLTFNLLLNNTAVDKQTSNIAVSNFSVYKEFAGGLFAGPGSVISFQTLGGTYSTGNTTINGVLFKNSP